MIDFIASESKFEFEWGVRDCVTFVSKALDIHTGVDILDGIDTWNTEEEAGKVILGLGKNLDDAARNLFTEIGLHEVTTPQLGDIAVHKMPGGYTFFICLNDRTMCCKSDVGITYTNTKGTFWGVR